MTYDKATPAPWKWEEREDEPNGFEKLSLRGPNGYGCVLQRNSYDGVEWIEGTPSDLKVIEVARELLEALEALVISADAYATVHRSSELMCDVDKARVVLAKAKGE